ncbi:CRISPR-associated protein Cas2 [Lachnospiraceae bacterium TWA4]|nr:CRISPR-associated protein Cas2 [Lachnospiraceae bacterium TWA4]
MNKTLYLISYDVVNDRLRNKIAKKLEDYGIRVQYSVFECQLTNRQYKKLYAELISLTLERNNESEEVNIRIYPLCVNCENKKVIIGSEKKKLDDLNEPIIVI